MMKRRRLHSHESRSARRGFTPFGRIKKIPLRIALAVFILTISAIGLIKSPLFIVTDVQVIGGSDDQQLMQQIANLKGRNLLVTNLNVLANQFEKQFPDVEEIVFKKQWPRTLQVQVLLRIPLALYMPSQRIASSSASPSASPSIPPLLDPLATRSATPSAKKFTRTYLLRPVIEAQSAYYIDKYCVPFSQLAADSIIASASAQPRAKSVSSLPSIYDLPTQTVELGKVACSAYLKQALVLLADSNARLLAINAIYPTEAGDLEVILDDGISVLFSADQDLSQQLTTLQTVFSTTTIERKRVATVDVRFQKPIVTVK